MYNLLNYLSNLAVAFTAQEEARKHATFKPRLEELENRLTPSPITVTVDNPRDTPVQGETNLRQAINMIDGNTGSGGTIIIQRNLGPLTDNSELPGITQNCTVVGNGNTVQANGTGYRCVSISNGANVSIKSMNIKNFTLSNDGVGIDDVGGGNVSVTNCTISNCTNQASKASNGAGLWAGTGTLTLTHDSFIKDIAGGSGGGVAVVNMLGNTTITSCTFTSDEAIGGDGGGLQVSQGKATQTVKVLDTIFSTCTANNGTGDGGGINVGTTNLDVTGCTFNGNSASSGGGLFISASSLVTVVIQKDSSGTRTTFTDNKAAGGSGGGMYSNNTIETLNGVTFSGNTRGPNGLGVGEFRGAGTFNAPDDIDPDGVNN
jgi:hypothetical protein